MQSATRPEVSVIVPIYNTEKYLADCIESILSQKFSDFELLLIDDGSTDASLSICHTFASQDKRIKVLSQSNAGVSAARNRGIDEAQAEWICFIDSDDVLEPDYLSAFFEQGCLEPTCLNQQGWKILREDGCTIGWQYPDLLLDKDDLHEATGRYQVINSNGPCFRLFNKPLLNELGLRFDTRLTIREDALFVYQYRAAMSQVRLLPTTSYLYRRIKKRISLSHQIHDYRQFLYLKKVLPPVLVRFIDTFHLQHDPYIRRVYNQNKSFTIASGIKALYAHKVYRKERRQAIRLFLGDESYYSDHRFQTVGLTRHLRLLYKVLPLCLFDISLYSALKPYYKFIYFQKF